MSGTSFSFGDAILNHLLRGQALSLPADFYLRLLTSPSSKGVVGVETNYSGYQRFELPRDTSLFSDPDGTARTTNVEDIEFPQADTTGSGDLTGFDLVDTPSGSFTQVYLWGLISPQKAVVIRKRVRFPTGTLIFTA